MKIRNIGRWLRSLHPPESFGTEPPAWTMDDVQPIVKRLQKRCHHLGYHVCLGGGVLNKGYSYKDLDLFILPFSSMKTNDRELFNLLQHEFGDFEEIGERYGSQANSPHSTRRRYLYGNRRLEVFVVGDNPLVKIAKRLGLSEVAA